MNDNRPLYNLEDADDEARHDEESLYFIEEEDDMNSGNFAEQPESGKREMSAAVLDEEDLPYSYGRDPGGIPVDERESLKSRNPLTLLVRIMFSPVEGWRALKRSRLSVERVGGLLFYPVCALTALSQFAIAFYEANHSVSTLVINAVISFMSLFCSFFSVPLLGRLLMPREAAEVIESPFGKESVMMILATLAIYEILGNVLPAFDPVIVFMPLWTIYVITRLVPLYKVPKEKTAMTATLLCMLCIGLPILWEQLLDIMLN